LRITIGKKEEEEKEEEECNQEEKEEKGKGTTIAPLPLGGGWFVDLIIVNPF